MRYAFGMTLVLFAIGWLHGLAYNGDILTDLPLAPLLDAHRRSDAEVLRMLTHVQLFCVRPFLRRPESFVSPFNRFLL